MHFSSFKLSGFKSFVDTVELKIDSGLTGIVGPNGCGKSNLVEAISWAMGENSPSSLRAGAMDNVIFAGSSDRPQRDLAEVTIKINNTDKNAPAQWNSFDTIEVKRSIQRNEGSTYKINDNEIRARDVQTLFADAATGSNSNTIISQGQISNLINMKPTERRIVLEEAAGITGIHTRRREAELRLKAAESNLDRLNDIIETLKSQLTGIKKQSRQASRYKNIATQIRVSEAIISFYRIEEVKDDQKKAEIALKKSKEFLIQATKESSEASNLVTNHTKKIPLLREQQTKDSESLHRLKTAKDMIDIENTRITNEANNVSELCKQIQEDINREKRNTFDARNNLDTLQKEYNDLRKKEVRDNTDTNYGTVNLDKIKKKHSDAEKLLEESQKNLNILETKKSSCLKNIDEHKEKILKLISKEKELKYEIKNLLLLNKSFSNLSILEKQITESSQKIKKNEVAFNAYESEYLDSKERLNETQKKLQDALVTLASKTTLVSKIEAEMQALTLLTSKQDKNTVRNKIKVKKGYESALAAAIGSDLDASELKQEPIFWSFRKINNLPPLPENVEPLSKFITFPEALSARLSQIGIINEAQGPKLQKLLLPGQKLVSKSGAMWRWDGLTFSAKAETVEKRRTLAHLKLDELNKKLDIALKEKNKFNEKINLLQKQLKKSQNNLSTIFRNTNNCRSFLTKLRNENNGYREKLTKEQTSKNEQITQIKVLKSSLKNILKEIGHCKFSLQLAEKQLKQFKNIKILRNKILSLKHSENQARVKLEETIVAYSINNESASSLKSRIETLSAQITTWESKHNESEKHINILLNRLNLLKEQLRQLKKKPENLNSKKEMITDQLEEAVRKLNKSNDNLIQYEQSLNEYEKNAKELLEKVTLAREEKARCETIEEQSHEKIVLENERLKDKLNCQADKLPEIIGINDISLMPEKESIEIKLERLFNERERLGSVNLRAEEEAEEVNSKILELEKEHSELILAISYLKQGIVNINKEAKNQLKNAFNKVNSNFLKLFKELFGGGTGHLELIDEEDPLLSGLELFVSPPGKKLQKLSLLSGGEQALTALALVFSVFLARPSPICILDEVDAPLDDNNVNRFCDLLEGMSKNKDTKFLVITHNSHTMARMNRLYGATMLEPGVTKLVSVNLEQAVELRVAE